MLTASYVEINIIGLCIIALMYIKGKISSKHSYSQKLFTKIIMVIAALLTLDGIMWIMDGKKSSYVREAYFALVVIYFTCTAFLGYSWIIYCDYMINGRKKINIKKKILYIFPAVLNTVIYILSIKFQWTFSLDSNNIYKRGDFFFIHIIILGFYFLCSTIIVLKGIEKKPYYQKKECCSLLLFILPPIIGFIIQSIFYGMSTMIISCVFSALIIFINFQNDMISTDFLTKINNRLAFDKYLKAKTSSPPLDCKLFLFMIDINNFKSINDSYGHNMGDRVLIDMSDILKKCCTKDDFIARLGGDEFAVIGERKTATEINRFSKVINATVFEESFEEKNKPSYTVSIGYAIFAENGIKDAEELIFAADKDMYIHKNKNIKEIPSEDK